MSPLTRNRSLAGLALLLVAHAVVNVIWIGQDQTLRSFDSGPYLYAVIHLLDLVRADGLEALWALLRGGEGGIWTGGFFLPYLSLGAVFGHDVQALRVYNLLFLAALAGATYLLGRRLHSARAGLLAAALTCFYPLIYGEARQFGADIPGTALTALALAALLSTERFTHTGRTALFGLAAGAAVMVRAQAAFFMALPAALLLLSVLARPGERSRRRALINVGLGLLLAGAVTSLWWAGRLGTILDLFVWHAQATQNIAESAEPSAVFYLRILPAAVSPFLLLALATGLLGLLVRRWPPRPTWAWLHDPRLAVVVAWLAGGLLFVSSTRVRYMRYMMPVVPALALLTAVGLLSIRHRAARRIVVTLVLAVASATWLVDSFWINTAVRWGYEDDPASTAPRGYYITSGPPATSPLFPVALELGEVLSRRHASGRGVYVFVKYAPRSSCEMCRRYFWTTRPLLASRFPGAQYYESMDTQKTSYSDLTELDCGPPSAGYTYMPVGRASIPAARDNAMHAYVIKFDERLARIPDPPRSARKVFSRSFDDPEASGGRVTVSVWHRQICP